MKEPARPFTALKTDPIDASVYIVGLIAFIALVWSVIATVPIAFEMVFNWYSVLAAASVVANVWLLAILARRPVQGEAMIWLSLFIFINLLWGSAEVMHRLMLTPEGNAFWSHMQFGLVAFLPTTLYLFIRSYTLRASISDTWRTPAVFVGGSVAVAVLVTANGVLPVMGWETRESWGYPAPANLPALMYVAWNSLISAAAVARLMLAYRKEINSHRRKPLLWLAISAAALCVGEAMSVVILPALGMGALPPLGVLANTIMAIGIIYTILRYGAFSLNIGPLADAVLAGMGEAVAVTDQSGKVVYANSAAEALLGGSGQVVGQHLSRIASSQLTQALREWRKLPPGQSSAPVEVALKTSGDPCILNVRISDADQAGWGHVFVLSDITGLRAANQKLQDSRQELAVALKRSQQLEHQLRREKAGVELKVAEATAVIRSEHARLVTSINSLHLGLVMTDAQGQLVIVNQETQTVLARSLGLGHGALAVQAASLKGPLDRLFGLSAKVSTCLATRTGQRYPVMDVADRLVAITVSPILDEGPRAGHLLGAVALIEDITDAENLERARDEFFSIASHELRTPLTAIRGNSGMLLDLPDNQLATPDAHEMLGDIHDASVRLIKVVNDFLDVALVEQGQVKYQLEPVDAAALVQSLASNRAPAPGSQIQLLVEGATQPCLVLADAKRLEQVIVELLDNAIKHTIAGAVTVKMRQIGERITVSVTDTGKGIDPEHRHLLFRKFQLASDNIFTRDGTRSTGLGLYLARRLMLGMGGRLELASSEPGIGSTFTITLPQASNKPKKSLARGKS